MKLFIYSFLFFLAFIQCKSPKNDQAENLSLPEDFRAFYNQFHTDSLFQLEHITFPLDGVEKANDGPVDILLPIKWKKEDWVLHKPFNDHNGSFERSYSIVGPVIIENISDKNDFFAMERRFALIDNEWHLIFYGHKK